jgi:hypothetical protein
VKGNIPLVTRTLSEVEHNASQTSLENASESAGVLIPAKPNQEYLNTATFNPTNPAGGGEGGGGEAALDGGSDLAESRSGLWV